MSQWHLDDKRAKLDLRATNKLIYSAAKVSHKHNFPTINNFVPQIIFILNHKNLKEKRKFSVWITFCFKKNGDLLKRLEVLGSIAIWISQWY